MREALSWHFVPAHQAKLVAKSLQSPAQAVILDLEDAVAQTEKDVARQAASQVSARPGQQVWLRTNAPNTALFQSDLACALANPAITGVLLPKVEYASQLPAVQGLQRGDAPALQLGLLIESALGVLNLHAVLDARPGIAMLMFGGAENGDLMTDLRCAWSPSGLEMLHARQHVLLCARAHRVQAVDGVYPRLADLAGLEQDTRLSRAFGFRARASVHPAQLEPIHRIYAATPDEQRQARRLIDAFEASLSQGQAAVQLDGRLVDYAMYRAAQQVLSTDLSPTETP